MSFIIKQTCFYDRFYVYLKDKTQDEKSGQNE